ncbi:MAG: cell division protein FtsQ [Frankiaceae bacterium]|jgi:cell division protein FtsQ|nr:cell division protein FtsQ [Frankiaceae bacterium]
MPTGEGRRTVVAGRETAHRFAQRARTERRRKQRRWLAAGAALLLVAATLAVVARSSLLRVQSVVVTGTKRQSAAEVVTVAAVPDAAPMWTLDVGAVRRRVAALPRLRTVTVSRSWPHTVHIAVTERQPVAVVAPPGGGQIVIDSSGAEIERLADAPAGLLRVRLTPAALADSTEARRPLVSAALAVAVALPPAVRGRLELVNVGSSEEISLLLTGGALVQWGSADRSARKAEVLTALLVTPHELYDVRAPDTPAVR